MESERRVAKYKILSNTDGTVNVQFFCDLSGALACTTEPIDADTPEQALEIAWKTVGERTFNRCVKCGRFVSDVMFNAEVHECVKCAPWENYPLYCHKCGKRITEVTKLCRECSAQLRYKGDETMPDRRRMRRNFMETSKQFGFGPEIMKQTKVCRVCHGTCKADDVFCSECGAILPRETLFDLYKSYHLYCPQCGTVVSGPTQFCPECGKSLRKRRLFQDLWKAKQ